MRYTPAKWFVYALYFENDTLGFYSSNNIESQLESLPYSELVKENGKFIIVMMLPCLDTLDAKQVLDSYKRKTPKDVRSWLGITRKTREEIPEAYQSFIKNKTNKIKEAYKEHNDTVNEELAAKKLFEEPVEKDDLKPKPEVKEPLCVLPVAPPTLPEKKVVVFDIKLPEDANLGKPVYQKNNYFIFEKNSEFAIYSVEDDGRKVPLLKRETLNGAIDDLTRFFAA